MKCHVCGAKMEQVITDLPFKVTQSSIVVMKNLPVYQCEGCTEFLLDDRVTAELDSILEKVRGEAELEVIKYAA